MRQIGSQMRETLEESGCTLHQRVNSREVILSDGGHLALYCENDHFAGHVIEIDGRGYEFCSSVNAGDITKLMEDTDEVEGHADP